MNFRVCRCGDEPAFQTIEVRMSQGKGCCYCCCVCVCVCVCVCEGGGEEWKRGGGSEGEGYIGID